MTEPVVQSVNAVRLAWAREHRDRSIEDWKRVSWSDESRFRLPKQAGSGEYGVRLIHEAIYPACQVGTVEGHDDSIMVWGVFS
ncbi:uncharacterized protein TNCV_2525731 [Trichonephila clavipes]|nr:uncharacterized protein TNCV_2525731 [Trichonephila clavipes]